MKLIKKAAMFGFFRALRKQSGGLFLVRRHSVGSQETRGSFKTSRAAMFGLFRALRKQSGGLFLVRRHSVGSQETRGSFKTSRAAMFGLDARITLAIFGALSVISGAALYSAIEKARLEQWRQYFNELVKAGEAYYLDTGQQVFRVEDLAINRENLSTWRGPYWSVNQTGVGTFRDNQTSKIHSLAYGLLYVRQASTWTEMNDNNSDELCVAGSGDCAEWYGIYSGSASAVSTLYDLFLDLDNMIDGGDGTLAGKIRYSTYAYDVLLYRGLDTNSPSL